MPKKATHPFSSVRPLVSTLLAGKVDAAFSGIESLAHLTMPELSKILEGLGFVLASENRSLYSGTLQHLPLDFYDEASQHVIRLMETRALYQLWYHPAGILLNAGSYISGGYRDAGGNLVEKKEELSTLNWNALVDAGFDITSSHRARKGYKWTSNLIAQPSSAVHLSFESHENQSHHLKGLLEFMKKAREFGTLMPFSRWEKGSRASLPSELYSEVAPGPDFRNLDTQTAARLAHAKDGESQVRWVAGVVQNHPLIAQVILGQTGPREVFDDQTRTRQQKIRARLDGHMAIQKHLYQTGTLSLPQGEEKRLESWVFWAIDGADTAHPVEPGNPDIHGLSLARVVLHLCPENLGPFLQSLSVQEREGLRMPDRTGWTFPLTCLHALLDDNRNLDEVVAGRENHEGQPEWGPSDVGTARLGVLRANLLQDWMTALQEGMNEAPAERDFENPSSLPPSLWDGFGATLLGVLTRPLSSPDQALTSGVPLFYRWSAMLDLFQARSGDPLWRGENRVVWSGLQWNRGQYADVKIDQSVEEWQEAALQVNEKTPIAMLSTPAPARLQDLCLGWALRDGMQPAVAKKTGRRL